MASRPWRGTLIFVGTAAAMAAAGAGRFAGVVPHPASQAPAARAASTAATDPVAPSGSTGVGPGPTGTDSGSTTTSGTVTIAGSVEQNRYGPVQVAVTFAGRQIIDVQTLQSPNRDGRSVQISERSVPVLAHQVVAAQSAHVDTVSGATYTSQGYLQSVQSAIDQRG
ncbi:FMN-binding protein [Cellulomonas sp. URHB0016]